MQTVQHRSHKVHTNRNAVVIAPIGFNEKLNHKEQHSRLKRYIKNGADVNWTTTFLAPVAALRHMRFWKRTIKVQKMRKLHRTGRTMTNWLVFYRHDNSNPASRMSTGRNTTDAQYECGCQDLSHTVLASCLCALEWLYPHEG